MAEQTTGEDSQKQSADAEEKVTFRVVYKKTVFNVSFKLDQPTSKLKAHIHELTGVPPAMMKLMYKGMMKDEQTLREQKVTEGCKMMVVGSTLNDVMTVMPPSASVDREDTKPHKSPKKESLSEMKEHKKVIEKGKPDDCLPGIRSIDEDLPSDPLAGMVNKHGDKVRLTFKLETDELWIGTKERTIKVSMSNVRTIATEPIKGQEEYHIMAIQMGSTEGSKYWIYWVPAQYVKAIKDTILGKW